MAASTPIPWANTSSEEASSQLHTFALNTRHSAKVNSNNAQPHSNWLSTAREMSCLLLKAHLLAMHQPEAPNPHCQALSSNQQPPRTQEEKQGNTLTWCEGAHWQFQQARLNELFKPLGKTGTGNIFQHISLLSKRAKQTHLFTVIWRRKELTVWSSTQCKVTECTTGTSSHLGKDKRLPHPPQYFNTLATANEQHLGIVG